MLPNTLKETNASLNQYISTIECDTITKTTLTNNEVIKSSIRKNTRYKISDYNQNTQIKCKPQL